MSRKNSAFTLVEILIVVIILGILAAIVIPQFSSASNDARESQLCSDLQTLRSQVELYRIQHMDNWPDTTVGVGTTFETKMTEQTDQNGATGTTLPQYGPYLQKWPTNPFNSKTSLRIGGAAAGANTDGWYFDPTSGKVSPDDNQTNSSNVAHSTY